MRCAALMRHCASSLIYERRTTLGGRTRRRGGRDVQCARSILVDIMWLIGTNPMRVASGETTRTFLHRRCQDPFVRLIATSATSPGAIYSSRHRGLHAVPFNHLTNGMEGSANPFASPASPVSAARDDARPSWGHPRLHAPKSHCDELRLWSGGERSAHALKRIRQLSTSGRCRCANS